MAEKCELLDKCGFFLNFKGNPEVVKQGWISMYCESMEKSELCARVLVGFLCNNDFAQFC